MGIPAEGPHGLSQPPAAFVSLEDHGASPVVFSSTHALVALCSSLLDTQMSCPGTAGVSLPSLRC